MKIQYRIALAAAIIAAAAIFFRVLIGTSTIALLEPQGPVAAYQRDLIRNMVLTMLVIVVPMFIALYTIAWKYRADNPKPAKYDPDRKHGASKELLLWAGPAVIVACLAILGWNGAFAVDPYQTTVITNATDAPAAQPLNIEVVALPWKWLFIYPQQNIATVNFIEFPVATPIHFELTADAPMSSFWIPQLGSQIYAMAAMMTQLNLEASTTGEFTGKDTEINGEGYAGMTFVAESVAPADFDAWVASVQGTPSSTSPYAPLTNDTYNALAAPSTYNPPAYYSSVDPNLFNGIMMKYMEPMSSMPADMPEMEMSTTSQNATSPNATDSQQAMPADMPGMQM